MTIYCTRDAEIARIGPMSIRQVQSTPPWFDVYYGEQGEQNAEPLHITGTLDLAEAWGVLVAHMESTAVGDTES